MFKKVLIANRGEVALRVMRACKELGVKTVAVYSTEDENTYPVQYADEKVCIGPAQATKSYLVMSNIIAAATITGADAIHPGYGFLAENADFARACVDNDLVFIGPSAECIERMGDKSSARETMKACGVPTVPGSDGCIDTVEEARRFAESVGYPVLIKATAGGGGKGMREVHDPADLESHYKAARAEAGAAFGNDEVYLEKLVLRPRHVEVQVLADNFGNNVALCERDCSVQRRHQKLIEEAPSPALTDELRRAMGVAAIKAVRAVDYRNAGTIEFLLDTTGKFYFMEMNTRVQVEHPVSEQITGTDIIKEQLRIASGEPMSCADRAPFTPFGHAMEFRINAEDPEHGFRPCPGRARACAWKPMCIPARRSARSTTPWWPSSSCTARIARSAWRAVAALLTSSSSRASPPRCRSIAACWITRCSAPAKPPRTSSKPRWEMCYERFDR